MESPERAPRSLPLPREEPVPMVGVPRPTNEAEGTEQRPLKRNSETVSQIAQPVFEKSKNFKPQELSPEEKSKRGKRLLRTATDGTDDLEKIAKEIAQGMIITTSELSLDLSRISFLPK